MGEGGKCQEYKFGIGAVLGNEPGGTQTAFRHAPDDRHPCSCKKDNMYLT